MPEITPRVFSNVIQTAQTEAPKNRQLDNKQGGGSLPASQTPVVATADSVGTKAAEKTEEEAISPKYLALARHQKKLRQQELEIKAREDALKARETEYETQYVPKKRLLENPLEVLSEQGVDYDQLVNAALTQPGPQDKLIREMQAEIKALKDTNTQSQTQAQEEQKRQYDQALGQVRTEVKNLVANDPGDSFESIKQMGAEEAVVELIRETFEKEGTLMTVNEAAGKVEDYLLEQALKMASMGKVQKKLAPPAPENQSAAARTHTSTVEATNTPPPTMKTITNDATSSPSRTLTNKERRDRAIAAFQGRLGG